MNHEGNVQRSGGGGGGGLAAQNEIGLRSEVQPLTLLCTIFDR